MNGVRGDIGVNVVNEVARLNVEVEFDTDVTDDGVIAAKRE